MAFIAYFLTRVDVLIYFVICVALFIYWRNGSKKSTPNMPPGPTPLPFIGNINLLDLNRLHNSLMELSEKYGEIYTLHVGPRKIVVLSGYKAVKEALVTRAEDFGERANTPIFDLAFNRHGVIFSNGELWKSMRRFTLSTLRDFGMGKKSIEAKIQDEVIALTESFKSHNGTQFNPHLLVNSAVSNVICSIIFGNRFEYGDPTFGKLIRLLDENAKLFGTRKVVLSEKYGEIYTLHVGPRKIVVLSGYKAVKEALVTRAEDFGERANTPIFDLAFNRHGVIFSNGELWKSMRRFTLSTLRDFGMGKKSIEAKIQDEVIALTESFKSHNGTQFNPHLLVNSAVSNVICSIIFGNRFEYGDPTFGKLIRLLDENAKLFGTRKVVLYNYYPFIGSLLGLHNKIKQNIQNLKDFILNFVKKRRVEFSANDITGYIDAYLMKQEQESTKTETYFDEKNLIYTVMDLFGAGTETTSTTIRWGILLMMKYPEIQKRVQDEIKTHLKPGQLPTVEDRKKMPYTDAVIHELQRFGNIVPLNLSHTTPTDVYFRGYCIPKGTEVIPLLTSVLYDKTQWKTPYQFNPNHFLDKDGKFVRNDAFMPFSAGRRACAGESLAKMELFLFFTGLLQAFTFYPPPGVSREDLSLVPGIGFTLVPTPYKTCAKLNY
ncbi:cytochrome P450 2K6-like isoform X2 [Bufo gargarizans]|uniref:cytochrome P450 2K6-like isoform X2 n=1 Tax=Bufo gargarizans TaxID=30331 RepID=UPI001CF17C17|nr:cytochrome P450 2K6-like isoform X2 [Bufo gargarizans]